MPLSFLFFFLFYKCGQRWGIGKGEAPWLWQRVSRNRQTRKKRNPFWNNILFKTTTKQNKIQALSKNSLLCSDSSPRPSCTSKLAWDPGNLSDATESTAAVTRFCDFFGGCWFTPLWRLTLDAVKTGCS